MIPESVQSGPVGRRERGRGFLSLIPKRCKNVTTKSQGTRRGRYWGKNLPLSPHFLGEIKKKCLPQIFFSYIHVKNKEGITVAEKMQ